MSTVVQRDFVQSNSKKCRVTEKLDGNPFSGAVTRPVSLNIIGMSLYNYSSY